MVLKFWRCWSTVFFCLGLLFAPVLGNAQARSSKPPDLAKKVEDPQMAFVIARWSQTACEPDCPEWIVAQGRIMADSAAKLALLLANPANRKLPLILNSYGGNIDSALRMGRLLRRYHMIVGVGWTHFKGCSPFTQATTPCLPDPATKAFAGLADEWGATCFSACPLVLLGGVERIVNTGSRLGLHEPITETHPYIDRYWVTWRMVHGHKVVLSRKFLKRTTLASKTTVGITPYLRKQLVPYLKEMGGAPEILDEMNKATPQTMNLIPDSDGSRSKLGLITNGYGALATHTGYAACNVALIALSNCVHDKEKEPH